MSSTHYIKANAFDRAMNNFVGWLARRGLSLLGTAELSVRGRKSGEWRRLPVNPLPYEGGPYLVSARGNSEWVRNMRAAGGGRLQVGRRVQEFTAVELSDEEKPVVLRTYLKKWGWEVGRFFGDVNTDSTDEELLAAAPKHPVFRITVKQ
ncbi:nitroreductase family deazaflavin-dependent oxidoreductase [Streptomyces ipomoeae]|jgi:deazaflavin-dependent oxidoreductase (nitroreductase family)|uniref:nitroreductase family deazaflavin-dependent oxidoreductase n=1 Tax=Streptomyces ipomoeae TaxID=103232 RepID=UPI0029A1557D|nr:nitroreductase family deazaflavin-dependent oxidoreductase [Streptomyces ipomoeae]MDX2822748.1 nitroreductase family deazaflavin-dependent oxidoreductase [Streptomyces ipomoeae]MDX2873613.1 nitroreductase family deazaflavin-dependent oxidoreductase [Streptomyces ipomoeae]